MATVTVVVTVIVTVTRLINCDGDDGDGDDGDGDDGDGDLNPVTPAVR